MSASLVGSEMCIRDRNPRLSTEPERSQPGGGTDGACPAGQALCCTLPAKGSNISQEPARGLGVHPKKWAKGPECGLTALWPR
eukprot:5956604-Alexandrium_andersonii.AAC.1